MVKQEKLPSISLDVPSFNSTPPFSVPEGSFSSTASIFVLVSVLLFPVALLGGITSRMAFIAPTRGSETYFKSGKLFFCAYLWLTSLRLCRKPPSGKSTIQLRRRGINDSSRCFFKQLMDSSRTSLPCVSKYTETNINDLLKKLIKNVLPKL